MISNTIPVLEEQIELLHTLSSKYSDLCNRIALQISARKLSQHDRHRIMYCVQSTQVVSALLSEFVNHTNGLDNTEPKVGDTRGKDKSVPGGGTLLADDQPSVVRDPTARVLADSLFEDLDAGSTHKEKPADVKDRTELTTTRRGDDRVTIISAPPFQIPTLGLELSSAPLTERERESHDGSVSLKEVAKSFDIFCARCAQLNVYADSDVIGLRRNLSAAFSKLKPEFQGRLFEAEPALLHSSRPLSAQFTDMLNAIIFKYRLNAFGGSVPASVKAICSLRKAVPESIDLGRL